MKILSGFGINFWNFYEQKVLEVIPTLFSPLKINQNQELFIRADYGFEEEPFIKYCKNYKCSIFSNSLIQPQYLQKLAANINNLFIFVKKDADTIPESYFKTLKKLNINVILLVKNKKHLNYFKNIYFDVEVRPYLNSEKYKEFNTKNKILSAKRLVANNKEYLSPAHWKKNLDNSNVVIDTDDFFAEIEHFYIYEQN